MSCASLSRVENLYSTPETDITDVRGKEVGVGRGVWRGEVFVEESAAGEQSSGTQVTGKAGSPSVRSSRQQPRPGNHPGWGWEGGVEGEPEGGRAEGTPGALPPSEIKHLASGIFGPSRRISHKGGVLPRKPTRESPAPHQEQGPLMTLLATLSGP